MRFIYLQDSSGDGLTDVEKLNGWPVTFTNVTGAVVRQTATADPSLYSTNGLVGDYIEKEFGLNPTTVDTAGSHMLDTWNLTFNVGSATSAKLPKSGFGYWYENSSYNPFANGAPSSANQNRTNLTPSPAGGIASGDGSPWAETVLWSSTALSTFANLTGVKAISWLRATTGTWKGYRTMTVWGKLSWGADPLTASSPQDGIADGSRISPSAPFDLSITVSHLYVTHLKTGQGYAAQFQLYAGSTATGIAGAH